MILPVLAALATISAHTVQGYISNFNSADISTTRVQLRDHAGTLLVEPASSNGNFTFLNLESGRYEMSLVSTTLNDTHIYSIEIDDSGMETLRTPFGTMLEEVVGYPIEIAAERFPEHKPKAKPRLYELYTDKTVLTAFGALVLLNLLPKVWQDMSAEDLKVLEGQDGLKSAFETAQKIANAKT